jgi:hypothetical protein
VQGQCSLECNIAIRRRGYWRLKFTSIWVRTSTGSPFRSVGW